MTSCCCSFCDRNGHSSQSCGEFSSSVTGGVGGEIMLFGVRLKVEPMRKCMSMNNLSQYENPHDSAADNAASVGVDTVATCYASADEAVNRQSSGGRERKRGVPWTKEEHKLFLLGLQKAGKGDWRGISRNFVKSRTPTQVASHAQKYFLRKNNLTRRRQRSSLFDMPSDLVTVIPMEEEQICQDNKKQPVLSSQSLLMTQSSSIHGFPSESVTFDGSPVADFTTVVSPISLPVHIENPTKHLTLGQNDQVNNASTVLVCSVPVLLVHSASTAANLAWIRDRPLTPLHYLSNCPSHRIRINHHPVLHYFR